MLLITDSLSLTWSVLHFQREKKKNPYILLFTSLMLLYVYIHYFEYARHYNKKHYVI